MERHVGLSGMHWCWLFFCALTVPAMAQKVQSETVRPFDLGDLKTFQFVDFPRGGVDPLALYPAAEEWVREAAREELGKKGIQPAESEAPDFQVRILASTEHKTRKVRSSHLTNTFLEHTLEGTLTLEFIDPRDGDVFWKGWARDRAGLNEEGVDLKPKKGRKMVDRAVKKILKRFFKDAKG